MTELTELLLPAPAVALGALLGVPALGEHHGVGRHD
jgi:hypothetical protein